MFLYRKNVLKCAGSSFLCDVRNTPIDISGAIWPEYSSAELGFKKTLQKNVSCAKKTRCRLWSAHKNWAHSTLQSMFYAVFSAPYRVIMYLFKFKGLVRTFQRLGSTFTSCSESKRTDDCEKHFARIYRNIGAYCVRIFKILRFSLILDV